MTPEDKIRKVIDWLYAYERRPPYPPLFTRPEMLLLTRTWAPKTNDEEHWNDLVRVLPEDMKSLLFEAWNELRAKEKL